MGEELVKIRRLGNGRPVVGRISAGLGVIGRFIRDFLTGLSDDGEMTGRRDSERDEDGTCA